MKWEYMILTLGQSYGGFKDEEAMRHAGNDEWELVAIYQPPDGAFGARQARAFFKRPKMDRTV